MLFNGELINDNDKTNSNSNRNVKEKKKKKKRKEKTMNKVIILTQKRPEATLFK